MKRLKPILIIIGLSISGLFIFLALVAAMIPDDFVYDVIAAALKERSGIIFQAGGFKRSFLYVLRADDVSISADPAGPGVFGGRLRGQLLQLDRLDVTPSFFRSIAGSVQADFSAKLGAGTIAGKITPGRKSVGLDMTLEKVMLSSIPALALLGFKGPSSVSGAVNLTQSSAGHGCPDGTVALKAKGVEAGSLGGVPVALLFKEPFAMDAELGFDGCKAKISRLTAEGADFGVLVTGEVVIDPANFGASRLNLIVGVTQKKSAIAGFNPMALLGQYKKSENFYSFGIRGSVERPEISN